MRGHGKILGFVGGGLAVVVAAGLLAWALVVRLDPPQKELFPANDPPFPRSEFRRIDAHAHLMVGALPELRKLMDRYGFEHIVDLSGGTPDTALAAHLAQARLSEGRISVFMSLPGRELVVPGYGERIASMLARAKDMGVRGFKVSKGLGLGFVDADDRLVPVDDPGLDPVFDACGRLGFPVAIHTADPKAFWQPVDPSNERYEELTAHRGWAFHGEPVPSWEELLDQLERRIARHPGTTFIAVHFGCAAEEPDRVARLLRKYPNLLIDTAARIPEFGRHSPARMRDFFIEFQDRILYGTDVGVGIEPLDIVLGSSGKELPEARDVDHFFRASYRYFESRDREFDHPTPIQGDWKISGIGLPREVLAKIYAGNARRVLKLPETGQK